MPSATPGAGDTVYIKFTTRDGTGAPTVLTGSPAISIYKDGSSTESTAGVSLTASFDSRVGLNHIAIDTSADGTFYANGSTFYAVITTGTVSGVSVVGEVVGEFNLAAALGPAAGGVTLADDVAHGGTLGSSTATLALANASIVSGSPSALIVTSAGGNAARFMGGTGQDAIIAFGGSSPGAEGGAGLALYGGFGSGANAGPGLECNGNSASGTGFVGSPGISLLGGPNGGGGISVVAGSTSGIGIEVITSNGDAVKLTPTGTNVHGINIAGGSTSGDAVHKTATDGHGDFSSGGNGKAAVVPGTLAIGS